MKVKAYDPENKKYITLEKSKNEIVDAHELNQMVNARTNPINNTIKTLLDLADIADKKQISPLGEHSDPRQFALCAREGAKAIIELQNDYYFYKLRAERYKKTIERWEAFSKVKFGVPDFAELIVDPNRFEGLLNQVIGEDDKDVNS